MRRLCILGLALVWAGLAAADERAFRLRVAPEVEASGLMAYLLPRFSLKTGRRVEPAGSAPDAEIVESVETGGPALMERGGRLYALKLVTDAPAARVFADWVRSDPGQAAIAAFVPAEGPPFRPAPEAAAPAPPALDGDAALGERLALAHCARCHRVTADRAGIGIGSTPSFRALRALGDWEERITSFYVRNPHPAFLRIDGLSPAFDPGRPPPIAPVLMTLADVAAMAAYLAGLEPADLGAPVAHQ